MRQRRVVAVAVLVATMFVAVPLETGQASERGSLRVGELRVDYLTNPLGIDNRRPRLFWKLASNRRDQAQRAYRVRAATSARRLEAGTPDLWDSGIVRSGASVGVEYGGPALRSRERVYWQVRAWDGEGDRSGWSDVAFWEMGLLAPADWSAQWIAHPDLNDDSDRGPDPVVVSLPAQDARYVRVDVTKLGLPLKEAAWPYKVSRLQFAEVMVVDGADPSVNLARGAEVTASESINIGGSWSPEYITDGLTAGTPPFGYSSRERAEQDLGGSSIWVQIDLGQVRHFDRVKLYPRSDIRTDHGQTPNFPVDFTVQTAGTPDGPFDVAARVVGQAPPPPPPPPPSELPIFARQFDLPSPVRSARLYVTGLGVYEARVNGRPVTDAVLQPPNTDYRKRVLYSTYDVTSLLHDGQNAIGVMLGNGLYRVRPTPGRDYKFAGSMGAPKVLAQLEITYDDGTTRRIVSDASWRTTLGPVTFSSWYGGEEYDARREQAGWDRPGGDLTAWLDADATTPPTPDTVLSAPLTPPIKVVDRLKPVGITQPKPGHYVFDFGTNFAGWEKLNVRGPAGTRVTLRPGEQLAADGTVDQSSIVTTGAPVWDTYTLAGTGMETWHPRFRYYGFRYLEVTGLPAPPTTDTITGLVLRAANDPVGSFGTSGALLEDVHRIIGRAITSNMLNPGTSDPNREKLGWLEETHLVFGAISRNYDIAAHFRELVRNMADAQTPDGLVPDIAPEYTVFGGGFRDDPNWGSAIILTPWEMYRTYGDIDTLRTYYGNMTRYLDYLSSKAEGGILAYGLGDWGHPGVATPLGVTATFGYFRSAQRLSRIAKVIGRPADAERYAALADQIGEAFNARFFDEARTTYADGTQAANAIALDMGVVPDQYERAVLDQLVADIRARNNHLTVGEIALPSLLRVLARAHRNDVIYDLANQTTYPSWGHHIVQGATSLPEFWDGSGEQNMFMLGAVEEWFSSGLAGIQAAPDAVAYDKLIIEPAVVGSLTHADATFRTMHGRVSSSWRRRGRSLHLDVDVPANTTATVVVPLLEEDQRVIATPGARRVRLAEDRVSFEVGSGRWSFRARAPKIDEDRTQVDVQPPSEAVAVVREEPATATFRLFNFMDGDVTVRPEATVSAGYSADVAQRSVRIPANSGVDLAVTVTADADVTDPGVLTLSVGDHRARVRLDSTDNVVRIATMSASSSTAGFPPAAANDGKTDSAAWGRDPAPGWNDGTPGAFPDTLTSTWQRPMKLSRVNVHTLDSGTYPAGRYGLRDYDVEVSVDGSWRTVAEVRGSIAGAVESTFPTVRATALRVVVRDTNDHGSSRVVELEGFGPAG